MEKQTPSGSFLDWKTLPSKLHKRTEYPPAFTNYRHYKPFLKSEFGGRCIYCRKSDYDQDPGAFHVEHYRPKNPNQFPELINEYTNLFYACAACNRFKSNYWNDEKSKKVLNPCDHIMTQHLTFTGEKIVDRSQQGHLNIELLRLNNEESMVYRKKMIGLTLLLIEKIINTKKSKSKTNQHWNNRAVKTLSKLTYFSESEIRTALRV